MCVCEGRFRFPINGNDPAVVERESRNAQSKPQCALF